MLCSKSGIYIKYQQKKELTPKQEKFLSDNKEWLENYKNRNPDGTI